jgi:hypothetical protein
MRRADEVVSLRTGICARSGSRVGEACPARHAEACEGGNGVKGRLVETNFGFVSSSADVLRPDLHRFKNDRLNQETTSQTRRGENPGKNNLRQSA